MKAAHTRVDQRGKGSTAWILLTCCAALALGFSGVWYAAHLIESPARGPQVAVAYGQPAPEPEPVPVKDPG